MEYWLALIAIALFCINGTLQRAFKQKTLADYLYDALHKSEEEKEK